MNAATLKAQDRFYTDRSVAIEMYAYWELRQKVKGSLLTFGIKKVNGDLFVRTRFGLLPVNEAGRGLE
jgi:hypothetical protein